ncbi:hypothetical protein B4168_4207 [Anoxybacillus flavithermus]|nr:hypothetical protein B4168_4207 [Anoxybacillus flavithermus]OAO84824.1 hypothetical protein GT23_3305 [Parageobacillus thermoglucosidasius]
MRVTELILPFPVFVTTAPDSTDARSPSFIKSSVYKALRRKVYGMLVVRMAYSVAK